MLSTWFVSAVGVAAVLVSFALWRTAGRWPRVVLAGLLAAFVAVGFAGAADLLGRPKPSRLERLRLPEAVVLWARIREGIDIMLLLDAPELKEPRYFTMVPFDQRTAEQLQKAMRDAERQGNGAIRMRKPFEPSWETREPRFYAPPQPAPPAKPVPEPPLEYRHPGTEA